jgi:hypothetical protein
MANPKSKSWLQKMGDRVRRLFLAVDDVVVQLRYGSFARQKKAMIARLKQIDGGEAALKAANDARADISVVSRRRIDGVRGRFSRSNRRPRVRISACGDTVRMVTTLWHELRHLRQHTDRGDLKGGSSRLRGTRRQHMIALMIEADAFTAQALMCVKEKKAGHPQYLEKFLGPGGAVSQAVRDFLKRRPYESFKDDGAFARALFGEIMKTNLPVYQAKYFKKYHAAFTKTATLAEFRALAASTRQAPAFPTGNGLMELYGRKGADIAVVAQLSAAYYNAQKPVMRGVLKLIEDTVNRADQMTESEFAAARGDILKRTQRLSRKFTRAARQPQQPVLRPKLSSRINR